MHIRCHRTGSRIRPPVRISQHNSSADAGQVKPLAAWTGKPRGKLSRERGSLLSLGQASAEVSTVS